MKKTAVAMLLAAMMLSMAACGKDEANGAEESTQQPAQESTQESVPESSAEDSQPAVQPEESMPEEDETEPNPLQPLRDAVAEELGENYWPNFPIDADMLEQIYGVSADMYDAFLGEMPAISVHVDTLLVVQAKSGQTEAVSQALNEYRDRQINDSAQYPMNIGKVQASAVEVIGDYVCFVQLGGDVTLFEEGGDDAVIEHCQAENQKAIDALRKAIEE